MSFIYSFIIQYLEGVRIRYNKWYLKYNEPNTELRTKTHYLTQHRYMHWSDIAHRLNDKVKIIYTIKKLEIWTCFIHVELTESRVMLITGMVMTYFKTTTHKICTYDYNLYVCIYIYML